MISTTRTLNLTIPIETLIDNYEAMLYVTRKIQPREEIVKRELVDLPWEQTNEVAVKFTVRKTKEVALTAIENAES